MDPAIGGTLPTRPQQATKPRDGDHGIKCKAVTGTTPRQQDRAGRSARQPGRDGAAVDMDALTFGLMTALATSLATSSAVAIPSHAPDAGVPAERPNSDVRADIMSTGDDPAPESANDDPSITGSVPRVDSQGARPQDAPRRLIGSGTPPDVQHQGNTPLDDWVPQRFDPPPAPARGSMPTFKEELPFAIGPRGIADMTPAPGNGSRSPVVPSTASPVAGNDGGFLVSGGSRTIAAGTLLANDTAASGQHLTIAGVSDARQGTVAYDAGSNAFIFTATAGYRGNASFSYLVKDDEGRTSQATVSLFVVQDETLFDDHVPAVDSYNDGRPVELGVKFVSAADGVITGLRFYKGVDNTGPHTASLWDASGNLLATTTFDAETGSGWQQVSFSSPVTIQAGVSYVASYHTNGFYAADVGYFSSPTVNGDLTAIDSVYAYGAGGTFPTSNYTANNYWVDVVYYRPAAAPEVQDDVLGAVDSGHATTFAASLLLGNDRSPDSVPMAVSGAGGAQNGTVSFDPQTQAVTFTPAQGYSGTAGFAYTVTDSLGASATANAKLWVNGAEPASFYGAAAMPSLVSSNDANAVELGFKFSSTTDGQVLGLRFYKGADDTGTHVANLWSANGDRLASATFTNETASGWQEVLFAAPVSLSAGATYVASYHSDGHYVADPGYFDSAHSNGVLIAPSSVAGNSNGLYTYGSSSLFPTDSFNVSGYGVDVLFKANLAG